jgi:hypothetical protein
VCFTAIRDLLNKTGVQPRQIKVVIVNCSLFNPTPSLSATIMNHFKMSSNTINYNLSGMGCSGGCSLARGCRAGKGARGSTAAPATAPPHSPRRPKPTPPQPSTPLPPPHPAGVIAVDMARQMLQLYSDSYALVVSTENITQNRWAGGRGLPGLRAASSGLRAWEQPLAAAAASCLSPPS